MPVFKKTQLMVQLRDSSEHCSVNPVGWVILGIVYTTLFCRDYIFHKPL